MNAQTAGAQTIRSPLPDTDLWARLRAGDLTVRNELVAKHMGLLRYVAKRVMRAGWIDGSFDDVMSAGSIGLIGAVEAFDPDRGIAFSTMAIPRIRGAILDDLRQKDHGTRGQRKRQRDVREATFALQEEKGRQPRPNELADRLGIRPRRLRDWEREIRTLTLVSFDQPVGDDEGLTFGETLPCGLTADDLVETNAAALRVERLLAHLSEREQLVLTLNFLEEIPIKEIGWRMGITESRVSQIRSGAFKKLRAITEAA